MTRIAFVVGLLSLAGSATGQAPGSVLYISDNRALGGSDTINLLDRGTLTSSTLYTFAPDTQTFAGRAGLIQGPSGEFYVADNRFPQQNPSTASISRIDNLFTVPSQSLFSAAPSVQNAVGMAYDSFTDSLLVLNNPGSSAIPFPPEFEGLQAYDRATGAFDGVLVPDDLTVPGINAVGGGLVATNRAPGQYYFGSQNGGAGFDPTLPNDGSQRASAIARTQLNDPSNPLDDTTDILVDLTPAVSGASEFLGLLTGMDVLPNGNIVFLEANSFNIWEVVLDGSGNFDSLNVIFDGSALGRSPRALGSGIIYNEFTRKLNYFENSEIVGFNDIVEINLDGTGRTILASGILAGNSLVAIPAPASAVLLAFGGLAAARRRR